MELTKILDDFEELIDQTPKIPMTGKIIIAEEVILNFIDKVRTSLPEEVKQANWIANERKRILEEAKQDAEKVIQEAHQHVVKIADESEVVKQAEMQSDEIIMKANEVAKQIHMGANEYADDILNQLEERLDRTINDIKKGREELQRTMKINNDEK